LIIQFEADTSFLHDLGDPIRADPALNQTNDFIEGEHLPGLRESWQRVNDYEDQGQNGTPRCSNCSGKLCGGILKVDR